MFGQL
jgi:hypothetical protein